MTVKQANILIIDDQSTNIDILIDILANQYDISVAVDGNAALELVENNVPDLILLDIMMPKINGYDVCKELKAREATKHVPVIFLTALSGHNDEARGLALGAVDYITKPFMPELIKARIRNQLELKSYQDHLELMVQQRTVELHKAHEQLKALNRVKDDFIQMISHEIRTPLNGILGIADFIFDQCPSSEKKDTMRMCFDDASCRLLNLIRDSLLLTNLDNDTVHEFSTSISLDELLQAGTEYVVNSGDKSQFVLEYERQSMNNIFLIGKHRLLIRAFEILLHLVSCLMRDKALVRAVLEEEKEQFVLTFQLGEIRLAKDGAAAFFEISSPIRGCSDADKLGLAPVVAQRILTLSKCNAMLVVNNHDSQLIVSITKNENI